MANILEKKVNLLNELGVADDIWHYEDYPDVLSMCEENEIIVLGGDIILFQNNTYEYDSSNWYYEGSHYMESINVAKRYLEKFPIKRDVLIEFSFAQHN